MILKIVLRQIKQGNPSIRLGLIVDVLRLGLIEQALEIILNPWMIVVKTSEETQTVLEKRMPLSEPEGEILKTLLLEILPDSSLEQADLPAIETRPDFWSFRIQKTQA